MWGEEWERMLRGHAARGMWWSGCRKWKGNGELAEIWLKRIEERTQGGVEGGGIVDVEDMAAVESDEGGVGAARSHLIKMIRFGDATLASAQEEGGTGGGEPVAPMVAIEMSLRGEHLLRLEGETPTVDGVSEGVRKKRGEARTDFVGEIFARGIKASPGKDEADVVGDDGADIFNDECGDLSGVECGELKSIDAAEGVAEQDGGLKFEVGVEGGNVTEVVGARIAGGVAGVAMAALIKGDDSPAWSKIGGKASESRGFHEVSVQCDEGTTGVAGVEIREVQSIVLVLEAIETHGGMYPSK